MAAAASYASFASGQAPMRTKAAINPVDGLSYSSAIAESNTSRLLKNVLITDGVAATTTDASTNQQASADGQGSVQAAGLAAPRFNISGETEAERQTESLASVLMSSVDQDPNDADAALLSTEELARNGCDTSHSDKFCVYEVEEGDTLSTIADKFGLETTEDVANYELLVHSNKPDIVDENELLQIGQKIRIPRGNGVIHTVLSAETLSDIATRYDVSMQDIVNENGISDADTLNIGDELLIPNPRRFTAPVTAAPETPDTESEAASEPSEPESETVGGGNSSGSGFIWPATGPLTNYFSARHPLGIDIDLYNGGNPPIAAAKAGTVSFAGGNPCCSYGYYVLVDHGDGFQTLYAHLSSIAVSQGQSVSQGELLGHGGTTGYSTGDHLHFEVHLNGSVVDPLAYLP